MEDSMIILIGLVAMFAVSFVLIFLRLGKVAEIAGDICRSIMEDRK